MSGSFFEKLRTEVRGTVRRHEPLSRHTTWKIGGPADLLLRPEDGDDLQNALRLLDEEGIAWFPLGAGSNLLVRDGGFRGAAIHTGRFRDLLFEDDGESVRAGSGLLLMDLLRGAADRGLAGLEALAGVPGTVGGALFMNAGAGGQQMADVAQEATFVGARGREMSPAGELGLAYRNSTLSEHCVAVDVRLKFRRDDSALLRARIAESLKSRRINQDIGGPNAGSVFKNPPGRSAWRLIDEAGFRGRRIGGAQVSDEHANFIVNAGNATARDILELIGRIKDGVRRHSGIELEPEVRIVGEDC